MIKKGFSLLEILLTLVVIASLLVLSLSSFTKPNLDYLTFMNNYLLIQSKSLVDRQRNELDNTYSNEHISFNENGNVNGARQIEISNHNIIIHLGNGYLSYE